MTDTAPLTRTLATTIPAQGTAGTAGDQTLGEAPFAGTVTAATLVAEAAITGRATDNRKFAIVNKGTDGLGTREVASITFAAGANAAAFDETALTLTATAANLAVAAGDVLAVVETINGSGMTHSGGLVQVEVSRG